jgi:hypothetical protein
MDIYKVVERTFGLYPTQVAYMVGLPVVFSAVKEFVTPNDQQTAINNVYQAGLISVSDYKEFNKPSDYDNPLGRRDGFMWYNDDWWEAVAIYCKATENFLVIRYHTLASRNIRPTKTLFRFQGSNPVEDATKRAYEIRDLKELCNIIRAKAEFFIDSIDTITIRPIGYDSRTNWCTYVVTVNGCNVGYTNFPLKGIEINE